MKIKEKLLKSSSEIFNNQVEDLTRIFHGYRRFDKKMKRRLEEIGYTVDDSGGHIKCYYGNYLVTTIASTPSDSNAGNQTLRYIRSFWEKSIINERKII